MKRSGTGLIPLITLDGQGPNGQGPNGQGPNGKAPLYRQLYGWFQHAIVEGRLRPGQRVPSTRALAQELKISRIPVLTAYQQLHAEGYLETFTGAGTCVAASIPEDTLKTAPRAARRHQQQKSARKIAAKFSQRVDAVMALTPDPAQPGPAFRVSLPALDHFPSDIWSSLIARHARHPAARHMAYGDPMGDMEFRETIAEYLTLGCVPPLVGGLARATDASGEWLATLGLGLGDAAGAAQAVSGPIRQVSDVLDMGEDVAEGAVSLLAAGQWRGLITALDGLDTSLKALKAPPPTPTGAPAGALSGG